eukprot:CAMPEP_0172308584 /NCGR_PEP_ID=MMETSP1058-20130122/9127_1 /TAXON_ID=83371 /ORGANISM="Detonula confervacea, Strain CCMP 353" /LENGTH=520 /DNA_ID=CAMNT_0013021029 /DNA_START=96 /DNA_END=1655 /DNA_ORIENTATION=-
MLPSNEAANDPKCLQVYFCDPDYQAEIRASRFDSADQTKFVHDYNRFLFRKLHRILLEVQNSYLDSFLSVNEYIEQHNLNPDEIKIELHESDRPEDAYRRRGRHPGRFHTPTIHEIAILLPDRELPNAKRSIICQVRDPSPDTNNLQFISDGHRSYEPLSYVLLFPFGTDGHYYDMKSKAPEHKKVSVVAYTRYHMMERKDEINILHRAGRLFQEWLCDNYERVESQRFGYLFNHQDRLRTNTRMNLMQAVTDHKVKQSGRQTLLPSSHTGSDRYLYKKREDGHAIVRYLGRPALFITATMNTKCEEVSSMIKRDQSPYDRPDIVCRVYNAIANSLHYDMVKNEIFGPCPAHLSSIEFQKRGAPHCHFLEWIKDFELTSRNVDCIICAEIPPEPPQNYDREKNGPSLYELVTKFMIHTCSPYCLDKNGICSKHFPHELSDETIIGEGAFVKYRRRSPAYLLLRYQSHINVECCATVAALKYLIGYPFKGEDLTTLEISNPNDEISTFVTKRYISSCSAAW